MEAYIPEACIRKFPELEDLLCFGCSAREKLYITKDEDGERSIHLCKSFAEKVWDGDLGKPSTRFDGCGLLTEDGDGNPNNFDELLEEEDIEREVNYIIPSKVFKNFEDFINTLQIPYYNKYKVVVDESDSDNCFNQGQFYGENLLFAFSLFIVGLLI